MANLYGRMIDPYHSGRREVTRTAATMIQSKLETPSVRRTPPS